MQYVHGIEFLNGVMELGISWNLGICVCDRSDRMCIFISSNPAAPLHHTGHWWQPSMHGHTMQNSVQSTTQPKAYNVGVKHSSSSLGNYRSPQRAFCLAEKDDAKLPLVVLMSCGKSKQSKTTDSKATVRMANKVLKRKPCLRDRPSLSNQRHQHNMMSTNKQN